MADLFFKDTSLPAQNHLLHIEWFADGSNAPWNLALIKKPVSNNQ